jgi:hypothetical protein
VHLYTIHSLQLAARNIGLHVSLFSNDYPLEDGDLSFLPINPISMVWDVTSTSWHKQVFSGIG